MTTTTPYRKGDTVFYSRHVPSEPMPETTESILFEDDVLVVADKPHGMPVTPAGDHFRRSLLVRLRQRTGNPALTPAHRLDRDTAGVVLFIAEPALRGRYQTLFETGAVEREYLALSQVSRRPAGHSWQVKNRIQPGTPWFRQEIVSGPPNAITNITFMGRRGPAGLFRIRPETGKKHQIRVHMAAIGHPVIGDTLYPVMRSAPDHTLQLLATRLSFLDPRTGRRRSFVTHRCLHSDT